MEVEHTRQRTSFRAATNSISLYALRVGLVALCGALLVGGGAFGLFAKLNTPHELPGRWVDGHFDTDPFRILWWGYYDFSASVGDMSVSTQDHARESFGTRWTERCGQPFPAGLTWTVVHNGKQIAQRQNLRTRPWCEDTALRRALTVGLGAFRAAPGTGYFIRIEPTARADLVKRLPLRIVTAFGVLAGQDTAITGALITAALVFVGAVSLVWALVAWLLDRTTR